MSKLGSDNEIDSLDAFFSDKLKDAEMQPSDKVWQHIEGSLNQDKKRRRGFFWLFFCGLVFIGAGSLTYVMVTGKKDISNAKLVAKQTAKENTPVAETKKQAATTVEEPVAKTTEAENKPTENAVANVAAKAAAPKTVRIQLGAFKKQIDKSMFDKTGLDVKTETNEAGVTRYYAEVNENEAKQTLEQLKQNGFADVFIKRNNLFAAKNNPIKSTDEKATRALVPVANSLLITNKEAKQTAQPANEQKSEPGVIAVSQNNAIKNTNNANAKEIKTKNADPDLITAKNNEPENNLAKTSEIPIANTTPTDTRVPEEKKTEQVAVIQSEVATTDSAEKKKEEQPINEVVKADSAKTDVAKKDSAVTKNDNPPTNEPVSRWAFLLTGGPNFFIKNTQNNLFNTSGETQPITYNGGVKAEYRLLKNIALSLGINYNYFIAKQDATVFYFDKNQTTDFVFYSSYGPMPVSMSIMMQDFNPAPWINTLKASYSYTSKLNTLQVPLEAKWYFLNKKNINLYTALGASAQFVLSEQTNLSVIKEHLTNYLTYNQVNANKFNAILMLGLGGDVRLYKKLYFTIDGGFRYGAANAANTAGIKTNLTYISANGGLKIKL